jgi:hypothetical protein
MIPTVRSALGLAVSARVPVLVWGGAGTGKSSAIREMAAGSGLACETVIASIREPSDFAGLPVVDHASGTVRLAPPAWAQRLAEAGSGILFLDEVSTAPPAVQAALLRVVLERTVGDLDLPEGVCVVAAANPPEEAADGWDLAGPLANRFCHLDWTLEPAAWVDGLLAGYEVTPIPELDDESVRLASGAARAEVASFIAQRPTMLHVTPADPSAAGRAWPSARTWEMAARLLAFATAGGATESTTNLAVAGAVGPVAAAEFLLWRQDLDLPDAEAVLADPTSFVLPSRGDRAFAAMASLTAAVAGNNTPERWEAAWQAIAVATDGAHADIAVAAVRSLVAHRPAGARPPANVLQTMAPVLEAAGVFDRLRAEPSR